VDKVFGVVEGFYRRPYTFEQRLDLIDFISRLRLNTYIYGPKADPYHRKHWRKAYPRQKLEQLAKLNTASQKKNIRFVYALSPVGQPELAYVIEKITTMQDAGIRHFSLFFDDIKVPLSKNTAQKQLDIVNGLYEHLRDECKDVSLSFCPTQYRGFRETSYIQTLAEHLHRKIDTFWTGSKVVSPSITEEDVDRITHLLKRQVLIWDNIFANDYLPGKIHRFPYRNRDPLILRKINGILINPMNNYEASKPLIYTAAQYFNGPENYDPVKAWQQAAAKA
jgi:hyaluronoglucosaminidase